jgi:hypothetical protein
MLLVVFRIVGKVGSITLGRSSKFIQQLLTCQGLPFHGCEDVVSDVLSVLRVGVPEWTVEGDVGGDKLCNGWKSRGEPKYNSTEEARRRDEC